MGSRGEDAGCHLGHPPVCPGPAHCPCRLSDLSIRVLGTQGLQEWMKSGHMHPLSPPEWGLLVSPTFPLVLKGLLGEALSQNWEYCVPSWVPICLPTLNASCPKMALPAAPSFYPLPPTEPPPRYLPTHGTSSVAPMCLSPARLLVPLGVLHHAWKDSSPGNQPVIPVETSRTSLLDP